MNGRLDRLGKANRWVPVAVSILIILSVGFIDYLAPSDISFSVFYLLGITLALWYVGPRFAICAACLSILSWLAGDWLAGAQRRGIFVVTWNAVITMLFYLIVIWLLAKVKSFQATLEARVSERAAELTKQIAESERLERELLDISEREQRRFGHDLHDGLCQHLLGTAIAAQILVRRLEPKSVEDSASAATIVKLVEEGILMARNMAHGLSPLEHGPEGLIDALDAMAASSRQLLNIDCDFRYSEPAPAIDAAVAMHLYRIAQEAISNAVRHGRAKRVDIQLSSNGARSVLAIRDDGDGLRAPIREDQGMGLRIMKHRASMIGGDFNISPGGQGGVIVTCSFRHDGAKARPQAA